MTPVSKDNFGDSKAGQAVSWREGCVVLLDQTALPKQEIFIDCKSTESLIEAIKKLRVRGAPSIGLAGAYGVVLAALEVQEETENKRAEAFDLKLKALQASRPTAVNLSWAVKKLKQVADSWTGYFNLELVEKLLVEAKRIHQENLKYNTQLAILGADLLTEGPVLTVCNTGAIATGGVGTALGIVAKAYELRKVSHVFACETRPLLQGIRLTTWELQKKGIPYTLICDNMAAAVMRKEKIGAVITGADRIAANGDVANKIGTYNLAILAKAHSIPFYVAAPSSTFDLSLAFGDEIPLEERADEEILSVLGENRPSYSIPVWNPSFDLTPQSLISAIICERGVINQPNRERIKEVLTGNQL